MKKYILSIIGLFGFLAQGQVVIGSNADNTEPSKSYVGLEARSNDKQGVQIPMVAITDITSRITPVKDPVDGMLVYNFNSTVPQGLFVWDAKANRGEGLWKQMADTSNIISSMLLKTQMDKEYNILRNVPVGTFVSMLKSSTTPNPQYEVVANEIGAKFSATEGITLPKNSGYLVTLAFDVMITNTGLNTGISGTNLHLHKYIIKLMDKDGNVYGTPAKVSESSVIGNNRNSHSIYATFSFPLTLNDVTLFPYIAYENETNGTNGGSYYMGKPAGNTGEIKILSARIHIERGMLAL